MKAMRAKVRVSHVEPITLIENNAVLAENVTFNAVAASKYPEDGSDEDNTFAKFTPSATFTIQIANPALIGGYTVGEVYYVDFSPVPAS